MLFYLQMLLMVSVAAPSPVKSIDINKIHPTPTKTVATPLFQHLTNGKIEMCT